MDYSEKSINKIIEDCHCMQSKLIISILYYCAATSKDIIYLTYKDFNIFRGTVRLGYAEYPIPGHVITALSEHVAKTGNRTGPIFRGKQNKPLYHKYIAAVITKKFGKLTKPHHIRTTRINEWMKVMPKEKAKHMARMYARVRS